MSSTALVVEDDIQIFEVIRDTLSQLDLHCEHATTGDLGLQRALDGSFSIIILDLNLPGLEGTDVCKEIRKEDEDTPILVLSAREDTLSKALLLELGADDYLTKPFEILELKARTKALLRRAARSGVDATVRESYRVGKLEIDFSRYRALYDGEEVKLTPREYEILAHLAEHAGKVLTRERLSVLVNGYDAAGFDMSVNSHINRIRAKIETLASRPRYVLTVRGVGYRIVTPEEWSED